MSAEKNEGVDNEEVDNATVVITCSKSKEPGCFLPSGDRVTISKQNGVKKGYENAALQAAGQNCRRCRVPGCEISNLSAEVFSIRYEP